MVALDAVPGVRPCEAQAAHIPPPLLAVQRGDSVRFQPHAALDFRRKAHGQLAAIRTAYESGLTLAAVARKFGMHRATITKAIIDAGGTIRPKGTKGVPS